jgi:serine/threonine protein kinase
MERSYASKTAPRDPLIGQVLHDRYRVERRIGKGGMGIVYLAEHVLLRRKVALKTLSERAFASEEMIARFHREATAAAAVGNEHVVGVTDMGQLEDGSYFVVLEYLDGVELGHAVAERGPFSVPRAARMVTQLCDALTAVHNAGIVHRDLKPENLFLVERNGDPDFLKVLDFGVCKVLDVLRSGERALTDTGVSLGTPQFMAPEQIQDSATVDERTDIYAAGAILYFALTGRAAFEDSTLPRLLMRICSEPPPPIRLSRPELPLSLESVIARAMALDPAARFQTADALRDALEPFARMDETATVQLKSRTPPALNASTTSAFAATALSQDSTATLDLLPKRRLLASRVGRAAAFALVACALVAIGVALALRSPEAEVTTREAATAPSSAAPTIELDLSPALEPEPAAKPLASAPPAARAEKVAKRAPAAVAVPQPVPSDPPVAEAAPPPEPPAAEPPPSAPPGPDSPLSKRGIQDVFR